MSPRQLIPIIGLIVCFVFAAFDAALAKVRIYRGSDGIPHVYGDTNAEVFYGAGYMVARDRLFQIEMRKRQALGRRAEVLGLTDQPRWANKFVEKDSLTRQWLDVQSLESQVAELDNNERAILEAYVEGINRAISEALEDDGAGLPGGFEKFGFRPEPWSVMDVVAMSVDALASYADFSFQDANLALYKFLAQKYPNSCDDVFEQLIWTHDPYAVTTMGDQLTADDAADPQPAKGCRMTEGNMPNNLAALPEVRTFADKNGQEIEPRRASMMWAVGRDRAEDANTIFVTGPQVGWHRPSYYYTIGLHGGDYDFIGMSAEGIPVFPIGFNRHYAWGITAGLGLQADLVALTLNEDGSAYIHNGEEVAFEEHDEVVSVKDDDPVTVKVRKSLYGPVIEYDAQNRTATAKMSHWRGAELEGIFSWIHSAKAMSYEDWRDDVQTLAYNYNLFYGDRYGRVGFAFSGRFAIRHNNVDKRLPFQGDGTRDPEGYTSPEDTIIWTTTDSIYNFNNRPTRTQTNSGLFWEQWSRGYQVDILKEAIDNWPGQVDWDQVWSLNPVISNTDVNYHPFREIFATMVADIDEDDPRYAAAQTVLNWNGRRADSNGDGFFDAVGLTVFDVWIDRLVQRTLGPTLEGAADHGAGGAAGYFLGHVHQRLPARLEEHPSGGTLATLRAFMAAEGAPGIHNQHDFFAGTSPREVALAALGDAVDQLSEKFESGDTSDWKTRTTPQSYFPTNTDRMPTSVVDDRTDYGVYANRGAVNVVVEYGEDGKISRSGFVNPLGGPEDQTADELSDFHLDIYANHELAPINLVAEEQLTEDGAVLILEIE
jgi:penicillin amidase